MRYSSIVREVLNRLTFHSKNAVPGGTAPMLEGLFIRSSGEFRLDGDDKLPRLTMIDLNAAETPGSARGSITLFLDTKRKHGWTKMPSSEALGLIDWTELVMDAVEAKPSDGVPDQFLVPHDETGSALSDQPLLTEQFQWDVRMAEITDATFRMQLELIFTPVLTRRASRRRTPLAPVTR